MKILRDILYKVAIEELIGQTHLAISSLAIDSRKVEKFGLFAAIPGTITDGHQYIDTAEKQGAIAIICETIPAELSDHVTYIRVSNSHLAIAQIAANFFDNPSHQLQLVGITGTNGKTTVATLLFELFNQLGHNSGLISTVKVCTSLAVYPATHTTPDPITINRYLRQMVDEGCKYAFMEVSSHGLDQHRVSGLQFTGGIFTNITHDHLDYHLTFNNYIRAKKKLFDMLPAGAFALLNADDKHWQVMTEHCQAHVYTFALRTPADFKAKITEARLDGMLLNINNREFWARLIGGFNAYNLAAVYGAAILLGAEDMQTLSRLSAIGSVAGRFQHITRKNGTVGIVDYAHTPDALLNVLKTIEDVNGGGGNVITVIGCGGDRDKTKRPEMARIAAERSQKVIFTSDNPRSEDPEDILNDMEAGLEPTQRNKTLRITDRAQAIKAACQLAQPGDIILVAGKGHETYQEIKGVKHPFDDMQLLKEQFNIEQN